MRLSNTLGLIFLAIIALVLATNMPGIQRYIRIRNM
jgi:uncharacterized protein DUF6893